MSILPLHLTLAPLHLVNESNQRGHWRVHHSRRRAQRRLAYWWLRHWMPVPPPLPLVITITRVAPRALDDDGNVSSMKAVIDGIADWLDQAPGHGQDRKAGLVWQYAQRKGQPREYAVEIAVEPGKECA